MSKKILDKLITAPQYGLPQKLLSGLIYKATHWRWRCWKDWQIQWFIHHYGVDMSQAAEPNAARYASFNDFFTRALRDDARAKADEASAIACPVDGSVSQIGAIDDSRLFQAKGHDFDLERLLGGSRQRAAPFRHGCFATLYLSPKDYHRIHMPLSGRLREMIHVPGRLFSVNARTARVVAGLFARNERLVCIFDTAAGQMALVLVGALFVGSMETVWSGLVTPPYGKGLVVRDYSGLDADTIRLERGAEMGRFNMGSTVLVLFEKNRIAWNAAVEPGAAISMGQLLGRVLSQWEIF